MLSDIGMGRRRLAAALAAAAATSTGVLAQGGHSPPGEKGGQDGKDGKDGKEGKDGKPSKAEEFAKLPPAEKWRRRYPQPVLVSDLIGRKVLDRNQGVLGFVDAIVATPEGEVHIAFRRRRLFALRGETVVVPNILAALLGPFVMLPEASDEEVAKLRAYQPSQFKGLDPGSRIQMALTRH